MQQEVQRRAKIEIAARVLVDSYHLRGAVAERERAEVVRRGLNGDPVDCARLEQARREVQTSEIRQKLAGEKWSAREIEAFLQGIGLA